MKYFTIDSLRTLLFITFLLAGLPSLAADGGDSPLGYSGLLAMPHGSIPLGRPGTLFYDNAADELYVTDTGNSRILLFDSAGNFRFEFSDPDHLQSPRTLVVDSLGRIWCVGGGTGGRATLFDYDGRFLRDVRFDDAAGNEIKSINSLLLTQSNRLIVISARPAFVRSYNLEGELLTEHELLTETDDHTKSQDFFGQPAIIDQELVIPMPIIQSVGRFTLEGKLIRFFGIPGGTPGRMSFPVAAAGDGAGNIIVLDKHRHVVQKYDDSGNWLAEYGGIGNKAGKLYHPTTIAGDGRGECFVAQTFEHRIQRFRVTAAGDLSLLTEEIPD